VRTSAPGGGASPSTAASDYRAKISREAACSDHRAARAGLPRPFGDPLSGIVLVAGGDAAGARAVDALRRSLAAVQLDGAYVTWSSSANLLEGILSLEPEALVAIGADVARAIDSLDYPLAKNGFSEAVEGSWFTWKEGTFGLRLPAISTALVDADAKRRFWRAFLALRALAPNGETGHRPP